jgi:hypothetical protein
MYIMSDYLVITSISYLRSNFKDKKWRTIFTSLSKYDKGRIVLFLMAFFLLYFFKKKKINYKSYSFSWFLPENISRIITNNNHLLVNQGLRIHIYKGIEHYRRLSYMFVQRIKEHDNNDSVGITELMTYTYKLCILSLYCTRVFY